MIDLAYCYILFFCDLYMAPKLNRHFEALMNFNAATKPPDWRLLLVESVAKTAVPIHPGQVVL